MEAIYFTKKIQSYDHDESLLRIHELIIGYRVSWQYKLLPKYYNHPVVLYWARSV